MIEHEETYKGRIIQVLTTEIGHRCGYIELLSTDPGYGIDYNDNYDNELDCHGGVTFSKFVSGKWIIGFDCAHLGDAKDKTIMSAEYQQIYANKAYWPQGKVWTKDDVLAECKYMIDQLPTNED